MTSRCLKGKSCGATCIQRSKWCELELGPKVSKSLSQARERIGVLGLFAKVREHGVKGHKAKFDAIRKELKGQLGRQIRKTDDVQELKKRLQKGGLLPKTEKSEEAPRREFTPLPASIKARLEALGAPRQLDRSPGDRTKTPPQVVNKKNSMSLMLDDISRIMRGESPENIQIASAPGFEGFKARFMPSSSGSKGSATGNTRWAREDAQDFDGALGKVRRDGSKSFNGWDGSYGSGAKKIGEGAYGTVIRNPDGTFVKRGAISDTEAALIKKLGENGLGPKLIAADINGAHPYQKERFVDVRNGRIAMGEVPGKPIGYAQAYNKIGGKPVADIYWTAMAQLHRLGIAHNDAHIDNILVDKKGVGRWVDLGLAQASPKAALAEAMGIFNTIKGAPAERVMGAAGQGNWQTRRWNGTGVKAAETAREQGGLKQRMFERDLPVTARLFDNRGAAQFALLKMGLTRNDVSSIIDHGIRSPMDTYTKGVWSKITDKQAQEILNILYDGI